MKLNERIIKTDISEMIGSKVRKDRGYDRIIVENLRSMARNLDPLGETDVDSAIKRCYAEFEYLIAEVEGDPMLYAEVTDIFSDAIEALDEVSMRYGEFKSCMFQLYKQCDIILNDMDSDSNS